MSGSPLLSVPPFKCSATTTHQLNRMELTDDHKYITISTEAAAHMEEFTPDGLFPKKHSKLYIIMMYNCNRNIARFSCGGIDASNDARSSEAALAR